MPYTFDSPLLVKWVGRAQRFRACQFTIGEARIVERPASVEAIRTLARALPAPRGTDPPPPGGDPRAFTQAWRRNSLHSLRHGWRM